MVVSVGVPIDSRYLVPIYLAPMFWLAALGASRRVPALVAVLVCAVSLGAVLREFPSPSGTPALGLPTPQLARDADCVAGAIGDRRNGIAGYWDAKDLQAFLPVGVWLAQYNGPERMLWNTTSRFFGDGTYEFAIVRDGGPLPIGLDVEALVVANGEPAVKVDCGARDVWIWESGNVTVPQ